MAKYREVPCKYYIATRAVYQQGRAAVHKTYCQHCDKYEPRAKIRSVNKKKKYNQMIKMKERD